MSATVESLIRQAREARGMTQADLAKALHDHGWFIDTPSVCKLERGNRASIRLDQLSAVASALGTSVRALLPPEDGAPEDQFERGFRAGREAGLRTARTAINEALGEEA